MKIGIDISKDTFDVASRSTTTESYRMANYENTASGIIKFKSMISKGDHCVMEATGPYWYRLAMALAEEGYLVSVVNPLQIKRFGQMRLKRAKTDPADARIICDYAETINPERFSPPPAYLTRLKGCRSVRQQLVKTQTAFRNQLHAFNQMHCVDDGALITCQKMLATIKQELENIDQTVNDLIQEHCQVLAELLQTIPSIGPRTTVELIIATQGFTAFESAKSFAAYIGICPRPYQSGTSIVGAEHICKVGNGTSRTMMYLCALSASRCNTNCRELYQRLVKDGKAKKVALIAVANKLIRQIFAVVKNHVPFHENYSPNICF